MPRSVNLVELPSALIPKLESLQKLLSDYGVEFALLFGSFSRGTEQLWSDIDIGIYAPSSLSLLEMGQLTALLEQILGRDVDLILLHIALERNPTVAYRAIKEGILFFCKDPQQFVEFKAQAILCYLDTAFLRTMVEQAFLERLRAGQFGEG